MQFASFVITLCAILFALLPALKALPAPSHGKPHGYGLSPYDFNSQDDQAAFLAAFSQYRPMQKKWTRLEPSIRFF